MYLNVMVAFFNVKFKKVVLGLQIFEDIFPVIKSYIFPENVLIGLA